MALTIPTHEIDLCLQLARPAFAAFTLTNDLFSWEKEQADAQEQNLSYMINAIWVLMNERSITELEAKSVCRDRIKSYVAESVRLCEETQRNHKLSEETRTYVEAAQYSVSGGLIWTLKGPRYHKEIGFSEEQLRRMREFGLI